MAAQDKGGWRHIWTYMETWYLSCSTGNNKAVSKEVIALWLGFIRVHLYTVGWKIIILKTSDALHNAAHFRHGSVCNVMH